MTPEPGWAPGTESIHEGVFMNAAEKYTQFNPALDSSHNLVIGPVPPASRVLEFGCATGYMSSVMKSRLGCSVTGVELCAEAAAQAREHCERVIVGDAERLAYEQILDDLRFDAVVFADVLEHLRQPVNLLRRIRPFLREDGMCRRLDPEHRSRQCDWRYWRGSSGRLCNRDCSTRPICAFSLERASATSSKRRGTWSRTGSATASTSRGANLGFRAAPCRTGCGTAGHRSGVHHLPVRRSRGPG